MLMVLMVLVVIKLAAGSCLGCDMDLTSAYCWDLHLTSLPPCLPDSLTYLDVYRSPLGAVSAALRRLPHLEILYLDENHVAVLEEDALTAMEGLTQLSLAGNDLTSVPPDLLRGNAGLRLLNLAGNRLQAQNTSLFQGLSRLEQLFLQGNGLERLEGDPLPSALRRLDLSGNLLRSVEPELFQGLRDATVALHDNPWHCDCRTSTLRHALDDNHVTLEAEPVCATPPDLQGLPWSQLGDLCSSISHSH